MLAWLEGSDYSHCRASEQICHKRLGHGYSWNSWKYWKNSDPTEGWASEQICHKRLGHGYSWNSWKYWKNSDPHWGFTNPDHHVWLGRHKPLFPWITYNTGLLLLPTKFIWKCPLRQESFNTKETHTPNQQPISPKILQNLWWQCGFMIS